MMCTEKDLHLSDNNSEDESCHQIAIDIREEPIKLVIANNLVDDVGV